MSIGTILLIIIFLMFIGVIPAWPHSRGWGYGPSGGLGLADHLTDPGVIGQNLATKQCS